MRRWRAALVARLFFGRKMTRRPWGRRGAFHFARVAAVSGAVARFGQKKEATRSCLRAAHTRMLHPSPHRPDLPGSLIAKSGRKLASPIMSALAHGLYENAKSHALDKVFWPPGNEPMGGRTANSGAAALIAAAVRG